MSEITLLEVTNKALLKRFILLQKELYKDDPQFIAPLLIERLEALSKEKNPYFEHAEAVFYLAVMDGEDVGRISAQIDQLALEQFGEGLGHFGCFEASSQQVANMLLDAAEAWLKAKGMTRMQGPWDLSSNEQSGLLVDGFDTPPVFMMNHGKPEYDGYIKSWGLHQIKDMYSYANDTRGDRSEKVQKIVKMGERNKNLTLRQINMKDWDNEIRLIMEIFNDGWSGNWGYVPFTENEVRHAAKSLKAVVKPWRTYICEYKGEPAAFMLTIPDVNHFIRDLNGSLFPFGWAKLVYRLFISKVETRHRVPLLGIRKEFHGKPIGGIMAMWMIEESRKNVVAHGSVFGDMGWILEDNMAIRNMIEQEHSTIYKTYRIFEKAIG